MYSNLLHYATIKLMSLLRENTPTGLNTVMDARSTVALNSRCLMTTVPDQAFQKQLENQLNYIQELERQLDNPEISQMKELIGRQQLKVDSQRAELQTLKELSIKTKLNNALAEKPNGELLVENEALIKQARQHKQERKEMRNMVTSHKNEKKSMETDKDERIKALHEDITVLNRERGQMEDDLTHKLRMCKNKIKKFKTCLSKSSSKTNIKLMAIIKTLKSEIRDKQGELHKIRSGPDITLPGIKPNEYKPPLSRAKSPAYLERERSPGYLERRDDDDYSFGGSGSDSSEEGNKTRFNQPENVTSTYSNIEYHDENETDNESLSKQQVTDLEVNTI